MQDANDHLMSEIIDRIRTQRIYLGMSFQDVANITGMSKSTLQRYETGGIRNIPLDKLETLAKALQVTPAYLMGWEENESLQLNHKEQQLLKDYHSLNDLGKNEAEKRVHELTEIPRYQKNFRIACRGEGIKEIDEETARQIAEAAKKAEKLPDDHDLF